MLSTETLGSARPCLRVLHAKNNVGVCNKLSAVGQSNGCRLKYLIMGDPVRGGAAPRFAHRCSPGSLLYWRCLPQQLTASHILLHRH